MVKPAKMKPLPGSSKASKPKKPSKPSKEENEQIYERE